MLEIIGKVLMMGLWYGPMAYALVLLVGWAVQSFIKEVSDGEVVWDYQKPSGLSKLMGSDYWEDLDALIGPYGLACVFFLAVVILTYSIDRPQSMWTLDDVLLLPTRLWWLVYPVVVAGAYFGVLQLCKWIYKVGKAVSKVKDSLDTHIKDKLAHKGE